MKCIPISIFCLPFAIASALWCLPHPLAAEEQLGFAQPFQRLTFSDNTSIELLQTGITTISDGNYDNAKDWNSLREIPDEDFKVAYKAKDETLIGLKITSFQDAFLLEIKVNGIPLPWSVPFESSFDKRVLAIGLNAFVGNLYEDIPRIPENTEQKRGFRKITHGNVDLIEGEFDSKALINGKSEADFAFQIADGDGGWVTAKTSAPCEKDPKNRIVVAFTAYPRTADHLRFRAIRKGCQPIEFTLENPSPSSRVDDWSSGRLPATRISNEYIVTLSKVTETMVPEFGNRLQAEVSIAHSRDLSDHASPDLLRIHHESVTGPYGANSTKPSIGGYPLDPSEPEARLAFSIEPTNFYPYQRDNSLILAEAEVDASGGLSELRILESFPGIQAMTSELVNGSDIHEIKFKGHWPNVAAKEAAEQIIGGLLASKLVVFINGEARSNGESVLFRFTSSATKGAKGASDFELSARWRPSKPLTPGQIISIGMVQRSEPETVTFTVHREDFTQSDSSPEDSK